MIEEPKKVVALKASHDKQDLVELPKFINFACDQGLLGDPDNLMPMSPQEEIPKEEKPLTEIEPSTVEEKAKSRELTLGVLYLLTFHVKLLHFQKHRL